MLVNKKNNKKNKQNKTKPKTNQKPVQFMTELSESANTLFSCIVHYKLINIYLDSWSLYSERKDQ